MENKRDNKAVKSKKSFFQEISRKYFCVKVTVDLYKCILEINSILNRIKLFHFCNGRPSNIQNCDIEDSLI